jgi:hypothetical protein
MKFRHRTIIAAAFAFALLAPGTAQAQSTRTWVSGVGDDANPCSRTAPCKTFAGAIGKTAAGGEINCLDPGGYGPVTITASITIDCRGTMGSILATGTSGIVVNGADILVNLRHLSISAPGNGVHGIRLVNGARLEISDVAITGFGASNGAGITIEGAGSQILIRDTHVTASRVGLLVQSAGAAEVTVTGGAFVGNVVAGIAAQTAGSRLRVGGTTLSGNRVAIASANSGAILSYGDNRIEGNATPSAFTGAVQPR